MTDVAEARKLVYREDCKTYGHIPDLSNIIGGTDRPNPNDPRGMPMPVLRAHDMTQLPHIVCKRCGAVCLIIDEWGEDYDDAVAKVAARVATVDPDNTDALTPHPIPGVGSDERGDDVVPIPLAFGVVWDDLPEEHPAKAHHRQAEQHKAVHADDWRVSEDV